MKYLDKNVLDVKIIIFIFCVFKVLQCIQVLFKPVRTLRLIWIQCVDEKTMLASSNLDQAIECFSYDMTYKFNKFNITLKMLDSIYHMTLRLL